ncbi:uncharacterized protein LOC115948614 [Geospiza fortis]|uniref:Uncharacterized protein LOC115948614 n=1 Tax=Geospiza fortis TaxID=48883 RepID=A0A8N5I2K9_GEOFO|nr:uncharacterized protein LOC115948614 [Geospiza fortis]
MQEKFPLLVLLATALLELSGGAEWQQQRRRSSSGLPQPCPSAGTPQDSPQLTALSSPAAIKHSELPSPKASPVTPALGFHPPRREMPTGLHTPSTSSSPPGSGSQLQGASAPPVPQGALAGMLQVSTGRRSKPGSAALSPEPLALLPSSPLLSFVLQSTEGRICLQPMQDSPLPPGFPSSSLGGLLSIQQILAAPNSSVLDLAHSHLSPSSLVLVRPVFVLLPRDRAQGLSPPQGDHRMAPLATSVGTTVSSQGTPVNTSASYPTGKSVGPGPALSTVPRQQGGRAAVNSEPVPATPVPTAPSPAVPSAPGHVLEPRKNVSQPLEEMFHSQENLSHPLDKVSHLLENVSHPLEEMSHPLEMSHPQKNVYQPLEMFHPLEEMFHALEVSHPLENISHSLENMSHPLEEIFHPQENVSHPLEVSHHLENISHPLEEMFYALEVSHPLENVSHHVEEMFHPLEETFHPLDKEEEGWTREVTDGAAEALGTAVTPEPGALRSEWHQNRGLRSDVTALDGLAIVSDSCGVGNHSVRLSLSPAAAAEPRSEQPHDTFVALVALQSDSSRALLQLHSCCVTPSASPGAAGAHCCLFRRLPLECRHIQLLEGGSSRATSFSIQLFQMLNHSVAYLHCELRVCLPGQPGCEQDCLESVEPLAQPSDRTSHGNLHRLVSLGPVWRMNNRFLYKPEEGAAPATLLPVLLGALAGCAVLGTALMGLWLHQRQRAKPSRHPLPGELPGL